MDVTQEKPLLHSRVIKTAPANWRNFHFIQQEDFKELAPDAHAKLKASILGNQFTQPFYVWEINENPNPAKYKSKERVKVQYCLDGKHRIKILEELIQEGYDVPEKLSATFIKCRNKKEAARLVLIYSSMYAKITQTGLHDFLESYELAFNDLINEMDLPGFSTVRFEQSYDIHKIIDEEEYLVEVPEVASVIVRPGDLFQLGDHRLICGDFQDPHIQNSLMGKEKCRIIITDPPYNLPASLYSHRVEHENFAMAAGEMSDLEFVAFLESIMRTSVLHSMPGAIHYIFMDWRHHWHMGEAGRRVYGSPIPKQLCVWVKDRMANGSFYRSKQELCFVFTNAGDKHLWNEDLLDQGGFYKDNDELVFIFKNGEGAKHLSHLELIDRIRTNVWNYPSATSGGNPDRQELNNHPTPKTVRMIADAILDTSNPADLVGDWFVGSGTTIIAADKTGRRCYASELEPQYVQSTILRYIKYCMKNDIPCKITHHTGNLSLSDFNPC